MQILCLLKSLNMFNCELLRLYKIVNYLTLLSPSNCRPEGHIKLLELNGQLEFKAALEIESCSLNSAIR